MSTDESIDPTQSRDSDAVREAYHYEDFRREIAEWWTGDRFARQDGERRFVEVVITASRVRGLGKWGAPDITLVSRTDYDYFWMPDFEVVTFELKSGISQLTIDAAYEAIAHKRVGTKAFLVVIDESARTMMDELRQSEAKGRGKTRLVAARLRDVIKVLRSNGVGLLVARAAADRSTWEEWLRAERSQPNPRWINRLLMSGFSSESDSARLRTLMRQGPVGGTR